MREAEDCEAGVKKQCRVRGGKRKRKLAPFFSHRERESGGTVHRALTHFKDMSLIYVHDFIVCQVYREASQFCI
jgi:hypothetical protein